MKLYERNLRRCVLMHAEKADDGEGGAFETVTDGIEFEAALVPKNFTKRRAGEKDYLVGEFTAAVPFCTDSFRLSLGDRFRAVEEGIVFTVTGVSEEPPASSVIHFRTVMAEAWIAYGEKKEVEA